MKKWAAQVDAQRRLNKEVTSTSSGSKSSGTSETEFTYFRGVQMENPYRTEDYDDDYDSASTGYHQGMPRIGSTTSLRSRSTTGDSALSMSNAPRTRPPRFPMLPGNAQPLSLRTQQSPGPTDGLGDSYFSPTTETPGSTRVSTSSGIFPFPKQVQASGWQASEEYSNSRYTAPAMGRITSRENQLGNGSVGSVGRTMGRAPAAMSGANAQMNSSQSRLRSASSPDISNAIPPNRRAMSTQPPMPSVPVPPFPAHIQYGPAAIANRSQSSSPSHASTGRSNIRAQSPSMQRERSQKATYEQGSYGQVGVQHNYGQGYAASYGHGLDGTSHQSPAGMPQAHTFSHPPSYAQPLPPSLSLSQTHSQSQLQFQMPSQPRQSQHSRTPTAGSIDSRDMPALSPHSLPTSAPRGLDATLSQHQEVEEIVTPSQIKVKVHCPSAGSTMTLVVSTTISYQLLKDRIDAKLQRSTSLSLSSGNVKLKYLDENDYVSIQSDEDVQTAIETWKEQQRDRFLAAGQMGEIELFCQR